jgi:DNA polymerase-1
MDASAFIHRAFYAIGDMYNSLGEPTGAAYGFTSTLLKLLREQRPSRLGVVFDSRGRNRRLDIYPAYKANREKMPPALAQQQPMVRDIVEALGLMKFEKSGFEADDVIAYLCRQAVDAGHEVVIVSGDKDFYQLLSPSVTMYDPDPKKNSAMDLEGFKARFGLEPSAFIDVQALMGDSSDNIPGVPKVGEKTALKLISAYQSLDNLYKNIDALPESAVKKNLVEFKDSAEMSRKLAILGGDVSLDAGLDDLVPKSPDMDALLKLFGRLDFNRFSREISAAGAFWLSRSPADGQASVFIPAPPSKNQKNPKKRSMELFPDPKKASPPPAFLKPDLPLTLVDDDFSWDKLAKFLREAQKDDQPIGLFLSKSAKNAALIGLGLAMGNQGFYVPLGHVKGKNQNPGKLKETLAPFLTSGRPVKVSENLKADLKILRSLDLAADFAELDPSLPAPEDGGPYEDLTLAAYLLNPDGYNNIAALAKRCLDYDLPDSTVLATDQKKPEAETAEPSAFLPYGADRANLALSLAPILRRELADQPLLEKLYAQLELPLAALLAKMEETGMLVDEEALKNLSAELGRSMEEKADKIYGLVGQEFNLGSPKQVSDVLFKQLKLPEGKMTAKKSGFSTDNEVLTELAKLPGGEVAGLILEWREVYKLKNTYTDKLPQCIDEKTGRIHTTFNQALTATGRLSSSEPNLQNIPAKSEEGLRIRAAFIAQPGWRLISADYSQIELRVMAHFSRDAALIQAFENDEDIHAQTAAEIFGLPLSGVLPDLRRQAKTINFGIIYGQGAFGLAKQLGVPQAMGKSFIERYFKRFPGVRNYMEEMRQKAARDKYVQTWFGRRRYLQGMDGGAASRREAERMAINTPIQGTAADVIKMAMLLVERRLRKEKLLSRIVLQVHDELVLEAPEEETETVKRLVAEEMSSAGQNPPLDGASPLTVKLKVDVADSQAWVHA